MIFSRPMTNADYNRQLIYKQAYRTRTIFLLYYTFYAEYTYNEIF